MIIVNASLLYFLRFRLFLFLCLYCFVIPLSFLQSLCVAFALEIVVEDDKSASLLCSGEGRLVKDETLFIKVNYLNCTFNGRIEFISVLFAARANEL